VAITLPRDVPRGTVAFTNARLVTMRGEEVIDRGTIVVNGERIAAVGPSASVQVPAGATVIDAAGTTIIPGLHDAHAHLQFNPYGTYSQLKASLDGEIARSRRYGRPAAALLFGFDDYQGMRYQLGREKCDELISGMAKEIRGSLRGADRLFRMDVDEFIVLLPETDLHGSQIAAQRLGQLVNGMQATGRNGPVEIRIRIGGAVFPHERVHSSEDLLREANRTYRALREAGPDKLIFDVP
jgi:diguanylate cyclase (GGDEF)-like protein